MPNSPLISVVIPTYNYGRYLKRAVNSAINQTYKNIEVLICDDGSTDNTKRIAQKLKQNKKVKYFYQPNKGLSAARNLGIRKSKGKFIAFLDSDDYWLPQKLAKQLKLFKNNPQLGLVYCHHYWVDQTGKITGEKRKYYKGIIWQDLLQGNLIIGSGSAALVKKDCFSKVGLFNQSLKSAEDWDMWLRIARHYEIDFISESLVKITQHPHQLGQQKWSLAKYRLKVMRKNLAYLPQANKKGIANFLKSVKILMSELIFK